MSSRKYVAFISYSHKDAKWADWLHKSLERYRVPGKLRRRDSVSPIPKRLLPIFKDRDELSAATSLSERIQDAIAASEAMIVICSPHSAGSHYVNEEILTFKRLGTGGRILPIIVAGEPDSETDECFPPALKYRLDADGDLSDIPDEPVAADARPGKDTRSDAKLKIIAGLLGVGLDDLKQREARKQLKLMSSITAASLGVAVLTIALAISAYYSKQDAQRRRGQAEDLVSFMLVDLRSQLEPLAKLDLLDAVGDKAMDYFTSLKKSDIRRETVINQAKALRQIGQVRIFQGRSQASMDAYNKAWELLGTVNERDSDTAVLYEMAQTRFGFADVHYYRQELTKAYTEILKYRDLAARMVSLEPGIARHQMELAMAEHNLGCLARKTNQPLEAKQRFMAAYEIKKALSDGEPGHSEYTSELADTISWIGTVESSLGNIRNAIEWRETEIALRRELVELDTDVRFNDKQAIAYNRLSDDLYRLGKPEEATKPSQKAISAYRFLIGHDPENATWLSELYTSLLIHIRVKLSVGELEGVDALIQEAEEGIESALRANPDEGRLLRAKATADLHIARMNLLAKEHEQALGAARRGMQELKQLMQDGLADVAVYQEYARAAYLVAEASSKDSATVGSAAARDIARGALADLDSLENNEIETLALRSLLLSVAGYDLDAQKLMSQVLVTDYRAPEALFGSVLAQTMYPE